MRSFHRQLLAIVVALPGCATTQQVRYVYQDRDFGVIGMPENSNRWPTHYRRQADRMMRAHFPDGHEILRAEEVVEGTRTLTVQGTNTAEVLPTLPTAILSVGRFGRSSYRGQADKLKLKECRIIYRRSGSSAGADVYAPLTAPTPTHYVDPNAPEHRKMNEVDEKESTDEIKGEPPLHPAAKGPSNAEGHQESHQEPTEPAAQAPMSLEAAFQAARRVSRHGRAVTGGAQAE